MAVLIPVPPEVREVAAAALRARDQLGSGGTLRGVVLATALATGYVVPSEVEEIRRWHQRHPEETAIVAGLYGGPPARAAFAHVAQSSGEHAGSGMVAVMAPPEVAELLATEGGEPVENLHVTMFFLPDAEMVEPEILDLVLGIASAGLAPITISLTHVSHFEPDPSDPEQLRPVVLEASSPALHDLRALVGAVLDQARISWSDTYAYRPHLTLGYWREGEIPAPWRDVGPLAEPVTFTAQAISRVIEGDRVDFPLNPGRSAALSASKRSRLPAMSRRVNRIDQQTLARLHGAAITAYEKALQDAGQRLERRARTKTARAALETITVITPAVLAAYGVTEDVLLAGAFGAYALQAQKWLSVAERQKLRAAAASVGLDPDEVEERFADEIEGRSEEAGRMLAAVLGLLARAALSGAPLVTEAARGEFAGPVPFGVARDALAIVARGATPVHIQEPGPGPAQLDAIGLRLATSAGPSNVQRVVQDVLGEDLATSEEQAAALGGDGREVVVLRKTWTLGEPDRPFLPHQDLDGLTWIDADHPDALNVSEDDGWLGVDEYEPGDHAGCFPAGTIVSGPAAVGSTLRWYEGEFVKLTFASGEFLTATPNHPVLTPHGWVGAGLLVEGDDVVRCVDRDRVAALVPGEHQIPAPIEDVAAAVGVARGVLARCVPVSAEHFHGDGVGSEVAVVRADGVLVFDSHPTLGEPPGDDAFVLGGEAPESVPGARRTLQRVGAVRDAPLGLMGRGGDTATLLRRPPLRDLVENLADGALGDALFGQADVNHPAADPQGIGDVLHVLSGEVPASDRRVVEYQTRTGREALAPLNAERGEAIGDDPGGYAERCSDLRERLAGAIAADRVVQVDRRSGSAHVYNLQTRTGWYIANGIIVHNCQCSLDESYEPWEG